MADFRRGVACKYLKVNVLHFCKNLRTYGVCYICYSAGILALYSIACDVDVSRQDDKCAVFCKVLKIKKSVKFKKILIFGK